MSVEMNWMKKMRRMKMKNNIDFKRILKLSQKELFNQLLLSFKGHEGSFLKDKYILVKGDAPVMLVAHLDTVHKETVKTICSSEDGNILMSPQGIGGDDRCGIYALLKAYSTSDVRPWLLFTCDEEIGCIGASAFAKNVNDSKYKQELQQLHFIIEIDRKGKDDSVYYECDNADFEKFVNNYGFKTNFGSVSDISYVAPALGVAAVNLSSGYYNAHTQHEYIVLSEIEDTISKVVRMVNESPASPRFEYIEASYGKWSNWYGYEPKDIDTVYEKFYNETFWSLTLEQQQKFDDILDYNYVDEDELINYINDYGAEVVIDIFNEMNEIINNESSPKEGN